MNRIFDESRQGDLSDHHVLELLERTHFHDGRRGLRLEHHFFFGEGVDAFACLDGWLANGADLQQSGQNEFSDGILFHMRFDDIGQAIENGRYLLAAEFGGFCDLIDDLSLGETIFDGCGFLGHADEVTKSGTNVKTSDALKRKVFFCAEKTLREEQHEISLEVGEKPLGKGHP